MAIRNTIRKVSPAEKSRWIEVIRTLQDQIADHGLPVGSPLEEAYYNLDQAIERLKEVK